MRLTLRGSIARQPLANTSRICDVPMPMATAPNAPCVLVWLSPQRLWTKQAAPAYLGLDLEHVHRRKAGWCGTHGADLCEALVSGKQTVG